MPYKNPKDKRILKNIENGSRGKMPYSWLFHNLVKNVSREKTIHSCQIPQKLSELLIKSCTKEDDIVLILFGGSGSEIEICNRLKRKYISAEIDEKYYKMIIDRLENGKISEKYRLQLKNGEIYDEDAQLLLLENENKYLPNE
jgi:DNA modification methylase